MNEPVFKPEEDFMKEIFKNITELNFIFLIPYNIIENLACNLTLTIKAPGKPSKSFRLAVNPNAIEPLSQEAKKLEILYIRENLATTE